MTSVRFVGDLPLWAGGLLAVLASLGIWRYYRRESRDLPGRLRWMLPLLRAVAFFLALAIVTGPVLHHRLVVGELGRVLIFLDASQSMGVTDRYMPSEQKLLIAQQHGWLPPDQAGARQGDSQSSSSAGQVIASTLGLFDETTRWRRAEIGMLDASSGLIAQLQRTHEIELSALAGAEAVRLWDSRAAAGAPVQLVAQPIGPATDLGSALGASIGAPSSQENAADSKAQGKRRTAVVLLTDGRHNAGRSPLEAARALGGLGIPVFAVGFGSPREPPDLALLEAEYPDIVFQKDRVRGTLAIKDQMPAGRSYVVQIAHGNDVLWQERLTALDAPLRRIDFEFAIDALVEQLAATNDKQVRHHAVPVSLEASITPLEGETEAGNNRLALRFSAITQSYRLLLVDGRARWETRYLRNVFERDEHWRIDTILVGPSTDQAGLPRGAGPGMFPQEEEALLQYDVIILGDIPAGTFTEQEQGWLRGFVERRGGGLILVDGREGCLHRLGEPLAPLVPVTRLAAGGEASPKRLQLTAKGAGEAAWMLQPSREANEKFWQELPAPHRVAPTEAAPGTEVLVEALVEGKALPAMVTRSFGAGRVLYLALDETWRWRYKAADTYHQRFWNQVARWIMPRPFAVSDQYVSLDTGPPSYRIGETAEIRARVQGVDGRPATQATVDALLWRDGRVVSTVSLAPDGSASGVYRGRTAPLAEGRYEVTVRASGFSQEAMKARTTFEVLPAEMGELRQVACNEELLREMADASVGRFLREEQVGELARLLQPLSSGQVIESDTLLWQSWWWFAAIVGLLTVEWTLRKRAGLL